MKVLLVNSVCGIRSTGRICTDIADVLTENGHECKIAYGRGTVPRKYEKYAVRIGSNLDILLHGAKARLFDESGFGSRRATEKFIEWVKQYNPDVIHLHNIHGYYINIEVLFNYLKTCGKKIIWTLHDCWAFTGHCSHFASVKCEQWRVHCSYCVQTRQYPRCILKGNVYENFEKKKELFTSVANMTLVTPSQWLADIVRQSYFEKYPVYSIPNGIDLDVFKPTHSCFREKNELPDKKIVLGVATAWSERKGLPEFFQLANILGSGYQVVLIGMTKQQIKQLPHNILGISRTNSITELAGIYSTADVFVNAGKEETMGLTTVEAMACGTPVVVSNLTAVPEVVTEDGGVIVQELTAQGIAEGIHKVLNSQYDPIKNSHRFEKKQQYKKYIDLYSAMQ